MVWMHARHAFLTESTRIWQQFQTKNLWFVHMADHDHGGSAVPPRSSSLESLQIPPKTIRTDMIWCSRQNHGHLQGRAPGQVATQPYHHFRRTARGVGVIFRDRYGDMGLDVLITLARSRRNHRTIFVAQHDVSVLFSVTGMGK